MMEVWKHIAAASQQDGLPNDNHKLNGAFGALAGIYGLDPSMSLFPG